MRDILIFTVGAFSAGFFGNMGWKFLNTCDEILAAYISYYRMIR